MWLDVGRAVEGIQMSIKYPSLGPRRPTHVIGAVAQDNCSSPPATGGREKAKVASKCGEAGLPPPLPHGIATALDGSQPRPPRAAGQRRLGESMIVIRNCLLLSSRTMGGAQAPRAYVSRRAVGGQLALEALCFVLGGRRRARLGCRTFCIALRM